MSVEPGTSPTHNIASRRIVEQEVVNQAPPLEGYNVFLENRPLVEAVAREGGDWGRERLTAFGELCGGEALEWGRLANENPPVLHTHDRVGHRIDEVEFHPAWHNLLEMAVGHAVHSLPWREPRPGAHVVRGALMISLSQAEAGVGCPVSMTYAAVPVVRRQPEVAAEWEAKLISTDYDFGLAPVAEKAGVLCGMAMTEKQGGSDVRANTTTATPVGGGGPGSEYLITGHKWFVSAPMCDAFLVLAQTETGLSCFFMPRVTPDGKRNTFYIQRLKDKLGNRSNASSEVEFLGAWARMIGEEGRGVATIIEMVNHTRLDCTLGSAALMRHGIAQASHHAAHRSAFGRPLIDQPLMQNVLADLAIESEAATVVAMRLARAFDAPGDESEVLFKRLATAVSKYWICKTGVAHAGEALEVFGGNGFVEEAPMARAYREAPVNSTWEGSGNVICLDVLRALARSPQSLEVFFEEVSMAAGGDERLDRFVVQLKDELSDVTDIEVRARLIVEKLALALQASLLIAHGDVSAAEAFCATRLSGGGGRAYGTLPPGTDFKAIIERHRPQV